MDRYVIPYKNIDDVRDIWESLYSGGSDMTPYQSYEWNKNVAECYKTNTYIFLNYNVRYFVVFDGQQPVVIAPLALPRNKFNPDTYAQILGEYTKINGLNLIYGNDASFEDFRYLIEYIKTSYLCALKFCDISSETKFGEFLSTYEFAEKTAQMPCIKCDVPLTQEEVYGDLGEKYREIINETLNNDDFNVNVEIYHGYTFGSAEREEINDLCDKFYGKKHHPVPKRLSGGVKTIKKIQRRIFQNKEAVLNFSKNENFVFARCMINGKMAGFFYGIADTNGYCTIPVMIIDYYYGEYCPELLMIYEFMRSGIENENLKMIDMSRSFADYNVDSLPCPAVYYIADYEIGDVTETEE